MKTQGMNEIAGNERIKSQETKNHKKRMKSQGTNEITKMQKSQKMKEKRNRKKIFKFEAASFRDKWQHDFWSKEQMTRMTSSPCVGTTTL
jgi:hypothetical protein